MKRKRRRGYIAAVISKNAARQLQRLARHPKIYCHYIVIAYRPDEETMAKYLMLLGLEVIVTVHGHYVDEKGQAVRVHGVPSEHRHPHITVSCAEGTPPVYSNELIAKPGVSRYDFSMRCVAQIKYVPY